MSTAYIFRRCGRWDSERELFTRYRRYRS